MAVDYATLKKGGFMRQKQKNDTVYFSTQQYNLLYDF